MRFMAFVVALFLIPSGVFAQELSKDKLDKLREVNQSLQTVKELQEQQVLTPQRALLAQEYYLKQAANLVGHEVTVEEVPPLLKNKETLFQQVTGFFTFANILWVFAGVLLSVAIIWLAGLYLLYMLVHVPAVAYELSCYAILVGAFYSGNMWLMLPACCLLPGCLHLTKFLHLSKTYAELKNFDLEEVSINGVKFNYAVFTSFVCTVVYGCVSYYYGSPLIGFLAVMSLFSFLGFSILVMPLCYCIGFKDEDSIPRTICAAFLFLGVYVTNHIATLRGVTGLTYLNEIYGAGVLFIGTFVYYSGLLIVSSRFYVRTSDTRYWVLQLVTILSGIAALYIGSVYDLSTLRSIGGTFFFLYVLEKYFEIPWGNVGWAWSLLGLSGGLYWLAGFASQHPEYFFMGLK
jgi:hypothetical protein